jgi:hypothetical protein
MMELAKIQTKQCASCRIEKPFSEFYHSNSKDGYHAYCKVCKIRLNKKYQLPAPDRRLHFGEGEGRTRVCTDCRIAKSLDEYSYSKTSLDACQPYCKPCSVIRSKKSKYYREYGIIIEQYTDMLKEQKGLCAGCNELMERPCVDHNHITGKIRGLLCVSCNMFLGKIKDSTEILLSLIEYLERG